MTASSSANSSVWTELRRRRIPGLETTLLRPDDFCSLHTPLSQPSRELLDGEETERWYIGGLVFICGTTRRG